MATDKALSIVLCGRMPIPVVIRLPAKGMSGFDMIGFLKILKIRPIPHDDEES